MVTDYADSIEKITELINPMIGKMFEYGSKVRKITEIKFDQDRGRVLIITKQKTYDRPIDFEQVKSFINLFKPIEPMTKENSLVVTDKNTTPIMSDGKVDVITSRLANILFDNIEGIKNDSLEIDKADAICRQVDSIIDVATFHITQSKNY